MPRSAIDATRFTPTTPHASAKPSNAPTRAVRSPKVPLPPRTPGPPGETPLERVARLRAAAARAREAQFTTADRVVSVGRVWADRLHVFTARSLIAITGELFLDWWWVLVNDLVLDKICSAEAEAEFEAEQTRC